MERRQTRPHDGPHSGPPPSGGSHEPPHGDPLGEDALGRDPLEDALGGERHERFYREPTGQARARRDRSAPRGRGLDFAAVFVLLDAVRRAVPRDLEEQLTALIREFLLTLRSLIDWYLDRLDGRSREPEVEEIPID
jgi:hypothetical protein